MFETDRWTAASLREVHDLPLPDLVFRAQGVHRAHHDPRKVQLCTLLSIKTGGCPEDCGYCPQSAHFATGVDEEPLAGIDRVIHAARRAKARGSTRFCMGAAWRDVPGGGDFDAVLRMVRAVREVGIEACCTLGMLTDDEAARLKDAGLTSYNHNLDTGRGFYRNVVTTRTYEERLATLERVGRAGIAICSGGIVGMGESIADRMDLLATLANLPHPPESVPINALVRVPGTPLADAESVSGIDMARMIATARIAMPRARVRLSAGRVSMPPEAQALCFIAGANSIFVGETLLTTPNPAEDADMALLRSLGLEPMPPGH